MAKLRIPLEQLPPPYKDGNHAIRFRITSEDRNSISEWSPIFVKESIGQISPSQVDVRVVALQENGPYELSWKKETEILLQGSETTIRRSIPEYDIFIKWSYNDDFKFLSRISGNTTVIYEEEGESPVNVRIVAQLPTHPFPPEKIESIQIFDTGVVTL
jgi:hypothetical protein